MAAPTATGSVAGVRPPQQARSRAALQRLLASAEYVLVHDGVEEFTIARVAEHAGVSVGGVYRRFASKEQLIDAVRQELLARLEEAVLQALDTMQPTLAGVLSAFTSALGRVLSESGQVIPAVLAGGSSADAAQHALDLLTGLQQRFIDAAGPHRDELRHRDPETVLVIAFRSILAAGTHRAAVVSFWPDGLDWPQWADEIAEMTTAYLTTGHQGGRP